MTDLVEASFRKAEVSSILKAAWTLGEFQQQRVAQIRKPFNFRFKINSFFFLSLINMMSEMRKNMHSQS